MRNLEREIGQICRKVTRRLAEGKRIPKVITRQSLPKYLGPPRFTERRVGKEDEIGIATGIAYTEAGGDVLYIEATPTPKDEKVTLTGHLGQVMQESAKAARSYVWSIAAELGLDQDKIESQGIHIHVPAGAVPKDGPSAGVTMATSIASAYSGQPTAPDVAMTGELTLTGLVLPVGGIKEKVLAAHRSGFTHLVLPKDNEADLAKLPEAVRNELDITLAETLADVIRVAIPGLKQAG